MLLDTSGLLCLLHRAEPYHGQACAAYQTVWVDEILHRDALELLVEREDKTYSLCDAVSFLLMRQRRVSEALTTDHHFEQEGFRVLLR